MKSHTDAQIALILHCKTNGKKNGLNIKRAMRLYIVTALQ